MAPQHHTLDPTTADPFDAYHAVFIDKKRLQWFFAGAMGANALLALVLMAMVLRPPYVIVKDRISGALPTMARAGVAPALEAADARVFFMQMLKLRFGWHSATLRRDMQDYLGQCVKEHRIRELDYLRQAPQGASNLADAPHSRMQAWESAELSNTLIWPEQLDDIVCSPQPRGQWRCEVTAQIVTQGLRSSADDAPPVRTTFLTTLYPVRHTVHTPSGLLVGSLRHVVLDPRSIP